MRAIILVFIFNAFLVCHGSAAGSHPNHCGAGSDPNCEECQESMSEELGE